MVIAHLDTDDPEDTQLPDSSSIRRKPQHIHRKLIRPLQPMEFPYVFHLTHESSSVTSLSQSTSTTTVTTILYLKPHLPAPSPFTILRREQVKQLPKEIVQGRLTDVEREEDVALNNVKARYGQVRRAVQERLQELR